MVSQQEMWLQADGESLGRAPVTFHLAAQALRLKIEVKGGKTMSSIPTFILKKLYVAGSLSNTPDGCQLQIKNTLAPATITGVWPASPLTASAITDRMCCLRAQSGRRADASSARPVSFDMNIVVTVIAVRRKLTAGEHRVALM